LGDEVIDAPIPALAQLIHVYSARNGAVLGVQKVPRAEVSRYGIVATRRMAPGLHRVLDLVEKPAPANAPSQYAVIGRYVLSPDIFPILRRTSPGKNSEIQLTDALRVLAQKAPMYAHEVRGQRHDAGDKLGFLQATVNIDKFIFVAGGRLDHFNQFGDVWTYRIASSYKIDKTDTTLHASVATGFSPPSSQDKIFGMNFGLRPEKDLGWDIGIEQRLWENRVTVGATYFHNDLSNLIGFNGQFQTLNLGAAETQGLETELRAQPIADLTFAASYTYLDAEKTSSADISQPQGARLPRRPRNEVYVSGSYLWWKKLRTTIAAKFVNAREEINFGGPNFDIEDYSFVNIAAEYEINPHMSIFGRIDNLTNEHYAEVFGFPALGRAAYGGVKVRF